VGGLVAAGLTLPLPGRSLVLGGSLRPLADLHARARCCPLLRLAAAFRAFPGLVDSSVRVRQSALADRRSYSPWWLGYLSCAFAHDFALACRLLV
jgi:hypothetical protein